MAEQEFLVCATISGICAEAQFSCVEPQEEKCIIPGYFEIGFACAAIAESESKRDFLDRFDSAAH